MIMKCKGCGETLRYNFALDGSAEAAVEGGVFLFNQDVQEDYFFVTAVYCPSCGVDRRMAVNADGAYSSDDYMAWLIATLKEVAASVPESWG